MSRFSPKPEQVTRPLVTPALQEVGGSYQCQTCYEVVHKALYAPETDEMGWRCSQNHLSVIKIVL